tara:strand:+ start:12396 stop:12704 length:309 start_codon:yes stop_codon:yes gene_type:complete
MQVLGAQVLSTIGLMNYRWRVAATAGVDCNRLAHGWCREYVDLNPMSVIGEKNIGFLITYDEFLLAWERVARFPLGQTLQADIQVLGLSAWCSWRAWPLPYL